MGNVVGNEFDRYVRNQIIARQIVHGSGVDKYRNNKQITYLNSQTSWVKLASSVEVSIAKLRSLGIPSTRKGSRLAKENILFGGTSRLRKSTTLNPKPSKVGLSGYDHSSVWGTVPMPGIESADIKTLNRGSIEKATVKIKAYSREQFDIIDLLYLRLGYNVLLEWGNSHYTSNGSDLINTGPTLIEESNGGFFTSTSGNYLDMLNEIDGLRADYDGNYDGLFGKVSNFNWGFNSDGSYDITITIVSLGDVIESLKTNITPNVEISSFINKNIKFIKTTEGEETTSDYLSSSPVNNDISAMLWIWKFVNRNNLSGQTSKGISMKIGPEPTRNFIGRLLNTKETGNDDDDAITADVYRVYLVRTQIRKIEEVSPGAYKTELTPTGVESLSETQVADRFGDPVKTFTDVTKEDVEKYINGDEAGKLKIRAGKKATDESEFEGQSDIFQELKFRKDFKFIFFKGKIEIPDNPLTNGQFDTFSACFIRNKGGNQYYLRFGSLLSYIQNAIIPNIKGAKQAGSSSPLININLNKITQKMYSIPNQISFDPRVCIVRNDSFQKRTNTFVKLFPELKAFRISDFNEDDKFANAAYSHNIYLNFNFIEECIESNNDEKGDVALFNLLESICNGLNKALGGINNLEPVIDKVTNTIKIIDSTPIPGLTKNIKDPSYALDLYGYSTRTNRKGEEESISNFIRKVDLKTAITKEYANMVTVGATSRGYVKGVEATAFSNWNSGLTDRFNGELQNNLQTPDKDEALVNYAKRILKQVSLCYGFRGLKTSGASASGVEVQFVDEAIDNNVAIATEFHKYLQNKNKIGNSVGFIPFKLNLTLSGISGMKIYNKLHVNSRFLPSNYGTTLDLIVTGITHKLSNNDWETDIETTVMPKASPLGDLSSVDFPVLDEVIITGNGELTDPPEGWPYYAEGAVVPPNIAPPSKGTPPSYNRKITFNSSMKTKYFPAIKNIREKKGVKLLALVMAQKEGFYPKSRSYKTNNPGNIGNTDAGGNNNFPTLKDGIKGQIKYLKKVASGRHSAYPIGRTKDIKPYYSPEIDKNQKSYQLTPYLPGYKFKYTGTIEQFVKIYATGARGGNSYISTIVSFFRKNGFTSCTEKTTIKQLVNFNSSTPIKLT